MAVSVVAEDRFAAADLRTGAAAVAMHRVDSEGDEFTADFCRAALIADVFHVLILEIAQRGQDRVCRRLTEAAK